MCRATTHIIHGRSLNDGSLKPEPLISEVIPLADMFSAMRDRSLQENEVKEFAPCAGTARFRGAVARQNNNVKHDQRKKSQNKHIQHYGANLRLQLESRSDLPWHRAMHERTPKEVARHAMNAQVAQDRLHHVCGSL